MALALELAEKGRGRVEPNPRVGCVLVRNGEMIGQDFHSTWGGPHAEVNAIRDAEFRHAMLAPGVPPGATAGATAYVTLEPCAHVGKTGPCTEALTRAGVKTVVAAMEDPNPLVRGKGFRRLREAGIEVIVGPGAVGAERLNRGFIHFHRTGRPYGLAKWAMTLDGKIADASRRSKWITGEEARRHARRLRDECDAIMVGAGTVLADDPSLTRRSDGSASASGSQTEDKTRRGDPGQWEASLPSVPSSAAGVDSVVEDIKSFQSELEAFGSSLPHLGEQSGHSDPEAPPQTIQTPESAPEAPTSVHPPRPYRRIILDTHARTPLTTKCVTGAREAETWIVISDAKRNAVVRALTDAGCRVIAMPPDAQGRIDLASLWQELGTRGVQQVLIEGGGEVLASAFAAGIVNEAAVYIAPLLLGGRDAVPAVGGAGFALPGAPHITEVRWERVGGDLCGRGIIA